MIVRIAAAFSMALAAWAAAADKGALAPDPLARIVLERLAEAQSPACIAVALVEAKTRFAYGCTPDAGPVAIDRDSLFEIGSITKGLTGILLADMVLKHELALGDPASNFSRPGAKLPKRGDREITLLDLATHTSGLPGFPPGFEPRDKAVPFEDFDADALYVALAQAELAHDIGLTFDYSNFGYMWLSDILSRRGGHPYAELVEARVLRPLGMTHTVTTLAQAPAERLVVGHDAAYQAVRPWDFAPELGGAGALRSSIGDMASLAQALAGRRKTPLDRAIRLAFEPRRARDGATQVGLAWFLYGGRIKAHSGGTEGFRATIAVDTDRHIAAAKP